MIQKQIQKALEIKEIMYWCDVNATKEQIFELYDFVQRKVKKIQDRKYSGIKDTEHLQLSTLPKEEMRILRDLETEVGPLPVLNDVAFGKGIVIYKGHIVELALCDGLKPTKIPAGINELAYLETIYIDITNLDIVPEHIGALKLSPFLSKTVQLRAYWK